MWHAKRFNELTNTEIFRIYELRTSVFVVSQKRIYQEVDKNDLKAIHVFKTDANDEIIAYARVFQDHDHVTFGRVVTRKDYRGQGLGNELMENIIAVIRNDYPGLRVEIESQAQVKGFYEKFLFKPIGNVFTFESTPHIKMVHQAM
ncbi:GNAT family N-acetyltransferase [Lentilactobacillus kisonensis]|nr:GNAT family N-acetyltransferase [Lentilactobacillus kisonensis]